MHGRSAALLILLATATACAAEPAADSATRDGAAAELSPAALDCAGLSESLLRTDATRQALAQAYGEPDSVHTTTEPNRHMTGQTDSLFTVFYPGLMVSLRTPPSARDLVSYIELTDNRYLEHDGIGVGAAAADVVAALGEPSQRFDEALVYDCSDVVEQPVTFVLQAGVVERIEAEYYVD